MKLIELLKADTPVHLGLWLGRIMPLERGRKIAMKLGSMLASKKTNPIRMSIMANQKMIAGELPQEALEKRCEKVCQSLILHLFEYFYYYRHRDQLESAYSFSEEAREMLFEDIHLGQALILVGPHLGNFDLLTSIVAACKIEALVLAAPSPSDAYKAQNKLRAEQGLNIMPMSLHAFRQARRVLSENGVVITGVDRPSDDPNLKRMPLFFGKPSRLPTFYEKLAIDSGARIRIGAAIRQPDGKYHVIASDPIYFSSQDEAEDGNIKKITAVLEKWLKQYPTQWAIIKPLWPDSTEQKSRKQDD